MGFLVSALSDVVTQANQIFGIIQVVLATFGVFSLFVAAIGLINTMTISLLERINEIGIMRAIGASSWDIKKIFLIESTLIGFFGGLVGIVLGMLGGLLFNIGLNLLAASLGGQSISIFHTPWWFIFFIIIFSAVVGFCSGILPAQKAGKLNALEALRYK
jgi:putative ABC transport system permease protein